MLKSKVTEIGMYHKLYEISGICVKTTRANNSSVSNNFGLLFEMKLKYLKTDSVAYT